MAFTIGNISSYAEMGEAAGVGHTFEHNNDQPFLIVMISRTQDGYGDLDSVSFNGVPMLKAVGINSGWHYTEIYYLANASIGTYDVVVVNDDDGCFSWAVGIMSVSGIMLADPLRAISTKVVEPGTSLSDSVVSAALDLCVSCCGHNDSAFENFTTDVGQIERWDEKLNNPPRSSCGVGSTEQAVGASTTMGHGWATNTNAQLVLASFKAARAGQEIIWIM